MRYIKKFENFEYRGYYYSEPLGEMWKVPLKMPDFIICLKKIGMDDEKIKFWKHMHGLKTFQKNISGSYDRKIEYLIIEKSPKGSFTWSKCDEYFREEDNASFEYKGEMKVSEEERKNYYAEIEMKKDAETYNL